MFFNENYLMLESVGEDLEDELDDKDIVSVHSSNSGGSGGGDGGFPPPFGPAIPPPCGPAPPRPSPDSDAQCFNILPVTTLCCIHYM